MREMISCEDVLCQGQRPSLQDRLNVDVLHQVQSMEDAVRVCHHTRRVFRVVLACQLFRELARPGSDLIVSALARPTASHEKIRTRAHGLFARSRFQVPHVLLEIHELRPTAPSVSTKGFTRRILAHSSTRLLRPRSREEPKFSKIRNVVPPMLPTRSMVVTSIIEPSVRTR